MFSYHIQGLGHIRRNISLSVQVMELINKDLFTAHCTGGKNGDAKQLCILAFLPDILDSKAEGRNKYIAVLKRMAEHFKDRPYSYFWAVGGAHSALEGNVGVGGFGYPALIALSPSKGVCVSDHNPMLFVGAARTCKWRWQPLFCAAL
jgi:hypothetical protein